MTSPRHTTIRIATLNCRGLKKTNNPQLRKQFIRSLRKSHYDIICLQETHANDSTIINTFNMQFQTKSRIWTSHCGIISNNDKFTLSPVVPSNSDDRFIFASIQLDDTIIAYVLNLYAPASGRSRAKANFFHSLITRAPIYDILVHPSLTTFILGDFNYSYNSRSSSGSLQGIPNEWLQLLDTFYTDCFQDSKQVTWHRGDLSSTIDFIFCSRPSSPFITETDQQFINTHWTDHDLLSIRYQFADVFGKGPGVFKANPFLAKNRLFRQALTRHLDSFWPHWEQQLDTHPKQQVWDDIKISILTFVKRFQIEEINWRRKELKRHQRKRNQILRQYKHFNILSLLLPSIETRIGKLQEEISEIDILKAGKYWREHGKKSPGFLSRLIRTRENKRQLQELLDPTSGERYSDLDNQKRIVHQFYTHLYTPEEPVRSAIDTLLTQIPEHIRLPIEQQASLLDPISMEDILLESQRSPKSSSPGLDGLPYEILKLVFKFPPLQPLIESLYNDALTHSIFPPSWNSSLMSLLPKKGDLTDLRNHRPISLANTDYKIFTRILNRCMMQVSTDLINSFQLGFLPQRYIADNGMMLQLIMEDVSINHSSGHDLALLLDQEKAYDRVNLTYLERVLLTFGFPPPLVKCIFNLMFHNQIFINVNGYLTDAVFKRRGLKQGDPISPLLYNLAFEPFLRYISNDPLFTGYTMTLQPSLSEGVPQHTPSSVTTKLLCYADGTLVFVHSTADLHRLVSHIDTYCAASNAKINFSKVQAISLSGKNTWNHWCSFLRPLNITKVQSIDDDTPLTYIGYPMCQSTRQRTAFVSALCSKLQIAASLHSSRSLSVLGKTTVLNSLILAKCWYVLRVTPLPQSDVQRIRSVASQFLNKRIFPKIAWATWCLPKSQGGLAILDPHAQQLSLYLRWLQPLLVPESASIPPTHLSLMIRIQMCNLHNTLHPELPLVFPSCRKSRLSRSQRPMTSVVDLLFQVADSLPRSTSFPSLTITSRLHLPLSAFFQHHSTDYTLPKKAKHLLGKDLFYFNPSSQQIDWIPYDTIPRASKPLWRSLYQAYRCNRISYPSLVTTSSPLSSLSLSPEPDYRPLLSIFQPDNSLPPHCWSAQRFRQNFIEAHPLPSLSITVTNWMSFWSLPLSYTLRNVIFRFVHKKLPCRSLLSYIYKLPPSATWCTICNCYTVESATHLLFTCPPKHFVWNEIIFEFLWPTVDITDILESCLHLDFQSRLVYCKFSDVLSPAIVSLISLAEIWKAHFQYVFNSTAFNPYHVLHSIRRQITIYIAEQALTDE